MPNATKATARSVGAACAQCAYAEPPLEACEGTHRVVALRARRHAAANAGHSVTVTLCVVTEYAGGRAPKQPYRGRNQRA